MIDLKSPQVQKRAAKEWFILLGALVLGLLFLLIFGGTGFLIILLIYLLYIAFRISLWALKALGKDTFINDVRLWIKDQFTDGCELSYVRTRRRLAREIEELNLEIENDPSNPKVFYNRGYFYYNYRVFLHIYNCNDLAINDLLECLRLYPNYASAYKLLADIYLDKKDFDSAIHNYKAAINLEPINAHLYCNLAGVFKSKGDLDSAIYNYTKAIELKPCYATYYHDRALVFISKNDFYNYYRDTKKAARLGNSNANEDYKDLLKYSYLYVKAVDYAIDFYTKILSEDITDSVAYYIRGYLYMCKAEYNSAINDFSNYLVIDNLNEIIYVIRGSCFHALGDYYSAIKDYSIAIKLKLNNKWSKSETFYLKGLAYKSIGKKFKSIFNFQKSIHLGYYNLEIIGKRLEEDGHKLIKLRLSGRVVILLILHEYLFFKLLKKYLKKHHTDILYDDKGNEEFERIFGKGESIYDYTPDSVKHIESHLREMSNIKHSF